MLSWWLQTPVSTITALHLVCSVPPTQSYGVFSLCQLLTASLMQPNNSICKATLASYLLSGVVGDSEYDSYLAGGRVLVHCRAGVSRSATIVIAYQMWKQKVGVKAAVEATRKARWGVMPNPGFLCQLMEYEQLQCDASGWPGWGFCRWLDHPLAAAARQLHDELLFGVDYGGPPLEPETTAYAIGPSRGQVDAPTVRGQEYVAPSLSDNSLQSPFAQLLVAAAAAEDAQPATTAVEDEVQSAL